MARSLLEIHRGHLEIVQGLIPIETFRAALPYALSKDRLLNYLSLGLNEQVSVWHLPNASTTYGLASSRHHSVVVSSNPVNLRNTIRGHEEGGFIERSQEATYCVVYPKGICEVTPVPLDKILQNGSFENGLFVPAQYDREIRSKFDLLQPSLARSALSELGLAPGVFIKEFNGPTIPKE